MTCVANILLVVANPSLGSHGLPRATALAQRNGATLTLMHAFDSYADDVGGSLPEPAAAELEQAEYEVVLHALEEMGAEPGAGGVEARTCVRVRNPFIEVTREVLRGPYDMVMKNTSPDRIAGSRLLTSREMHLVRKCPSALWLMKPTRQTRLGVVMAAIDPAPSHEERQELNQRIIELALDVGAEERAVLHVAHAWCLRSESSLGLMRRSLSGGYVRRLVEEERLRRTALVEELASPRSRAARGGSRSAATASPGHRHGTVQRLTKSFMTATRQRRSARARGALMRHANSSVRAEAEMASTAGCRIRRSAEMA